MSKAYIKGILKPGLKLIGAKTKIRPFLYEHFPPHEVYIESFLGSGTVVVGKNKANLEIASDINEYVINFYKVLQDNPEEFWLRYQWELEKLQERGEEYFTRLKNSVTMREEGGYIARAVEFYLICKCGWNGVWRLNSKGECTTPYCGQTNARGFYDRDWFDKVRERIKNIFFSCRDYSESLEEATSHSYPYRSLAGLPNEISWVKPEVFVFLDPPYRFKSIENNTTGCVTTYNGITFKDEEHIKLKERLTPANYKWLLTINDDPWIRELYKDFNIKEHKVHYSVSQTPAGRSKRPELLIANYDLNV